MRNHEEQLADLLRSALAGDAAAYRAFLGELTLRLRPAVRSACQRAGLPAADVEDMLQDVLLAIHTKRQTWEPSAKLGPWVHAIVRYKVIDGFRRRGRRDEIPIDDVLETLPAEAPQGEPNARDMIETFLPSLSGRQYDVVKAISLDHASIRQTAERLSMTEGAVRVTLHRAIAALAKAYRGSLS